MTSPTDAASRGDHPVTSYIGLDSERHPVPHDGPPPPAFDLCVAGVVEAGHGVASGRGPSAPHAEGSIARQYPHFLRGGLDLGACYPGTLNVSIRPRTFRIHRPEHVFDDVRWSPVQPPERVLFARCWIDAGVRCVAGRVYQPDPATKTVHFDDPTQMQIVAALLPSVTYGVEVVLFVRSDEIELLANRTGGG